MAQANVFYKGEEKKFAISIEAAGFDIDTDDFDLEVSTPKAGDSISVSKSGEPNEQGIWSNEDGSLVVFYETVTPTEGDPYKQWFGIVDTQYFNSTGQLNVTATAYITDAKAYDGVRKCIDQAVLGTLKNK